MKNLTSSLPFPYGFFIGLPLCLKQETQRMKRALRFTGVAAVAVLIPSLLFAQSNPLVGSWKLNIKKSKSGSVLIPPNLAVAHRFCNISRSNRDLTLAIHIRCHNFRWRLSFGERILPL